MNENRTAEDVLQDEYENRSATINSPDSSSFVEIVGDSSALGQPVCARVLEESGEVMVKVMHSSDLMDSQWEHERDGYRVWFDAVTVEERERTITETVTTFGHMM